MTKLYRNTSDPESRAFWEGVDKTAAEVKDAPAWTKAGLVLNPRHFETYGARHGGDVVGKAGESAGDE